MKLGVTLDILNQKDTPAFYADTLANRPAAGFTGRIFVSTDTLDLYRDTGTTWVLLSPSSTGTITGSGAANQVTYFSSASSITGSNNLFWDSTNFRLGINNNTPGAALDVHGTQSTILQLNQTSINDARIAFQLSGSALWRLGNYYNGGANDFELFDVIGAQASITIKKTTGQVLIGTSSVGAGKLVVSSTSSDNGVQIVGANAPSLRLDNAVTGATKRAGLGISTAVNNFIQGSADRDFCIFNGSTTAASPMLFGIYDAGLTNVQEAARISAARNFIIGSTTDNGLKLQVTGNSYVSGALGIGVTNMSSYNGGGNQFVIGGGGFRGLTIAATTEGNIYFADGTSGLDAYRGVVGYNHTTNSLFFYSDAIERMRITSNGNVLIGTATNGSSKLRIVGLPTSAAGLSSGDIYSNAGILTIVP